MSIEELWEGMFLEKINQINIENCFEFLGCKIDEDLEFIRKKFYYHFLYFKVHMANIHNYYKELKKITGEK